MMKLDPCGMDKYFRLVLAPGYWQSLEPLAIQGNEKEGETVSGTERIYTFLPTHFRKRQLLSGNNFL